MTDQEIVKRDIDALYLGNLGTVEFDLRLPSRGKNGSQITWQSDNPSFMDHLGRVTRPAYGRGNRTVTLTACFTYGGYAEKRQYPVTVLEKGNNIKVAEVLPIAVNAVRGERTCLPSASAVKTQDGRVIARFLEWDGGLEHVWEQAGLYQVRGRLCGTDIPAVCRVQVREASAEKPFPPVKLRESLEKNVTLLEGSCFCDAQERVHQYLLHTDPDHWLYNFRQAAGLPVVAAEPMTGWDAPEGLLRGHSTGHYLSALALCWRATGDEEILQKARYMVNALAECQDAFAAQEGYHPGFLSAYSEEQFDLLEVLTPYPKIWAPYYTLHKILAGLLDLYRLAGLQKARTMAEGIGDWIYARLSRLGHEQRVKMWRTYIAGEYGGMNESLADLYLLTGKEEYLTAARYFDNDRLFYPLEQGADALDGMHANQHIPQIVGAMRVYEASGEERYHEIAERFWRAAGSRMYAPGGVGESEMFHRSGKVAGLLTASTQESCATYNMLKLTKELYQYRPDAAYMDYYERAAFNHILASCDHQPTGGTTYFLSMLPGAVKEFDRSGNSCCHGSGMESQFKYAEGICCRGADGIYVNLLIPFRLCCPEEGLTLTLKVDASDPGAAEITLESEKPCTLHIRKPCWADGDALIDGIPVSETDGYLTLRREGAACDKLQIKFPCPLRYEQSPDRADCFTVHYGPYILAALTDQADRFFLRAGQPDSNFVREPDRPLAFRCRENGILFVPLAHVWREEYQVYLQKR